MGASLSEQQEELLCTDVPWRHIVLLFDGDEAGREATETCLQRLGKRLYVRAIMLGDDEEPDQLTVESAKELIVG